MHYLSRLREDKDIQSSILQAIGLLKNYNVIGAMYEVCHQRSLPEPAASNLVEHAALRAAWKDGYMEALDDLASFQDYLGMPSSAKFKKPLADFSAARALLERKEITQEEYERLTGNA